MGTARQVGQEAVGVDCEIDADEAPDVWTFSSVCAPRKC